MSLAVVDCGRVCLLLMSAGVIAWSWFCLRVVVDVDIRCFLPVIVAGCSFLSFGAAVCFCLLLFVAAADCCYYSLLLFAGLLFVGVV